VWGRGKNLIFDPSADYASPGEGGCTFLRSNKWLKPALAIAYKYPAMTSLGQCAPR